QAYVVGEVAQPGAYQISSLGTVLTALYAAGGVTERAKLRGVEVRRFGKVIATLDLYDYLLHGDTKSDIRLETGDVVFVAVHGTRVDLTGAVRRPATYELKAGETLADLIGAAGGFRPEAARERIKLVRVVPPVDRGTRGQLATTVRFPLDSSYLIDRDSTGRFIGPPGLPFAASGTAPEVPLEPYDNVLILKQPEFELQRTVTIAGEVRYPGTYALKTKSDRLAILVQRAGGLTPQAYADGIRFYRQVNGSGRINIDVPNALCDTTVRDNVLLQPGDSLFIPEYIPSVKVVGAVNAPGSVLYRKGAGLGYYIDAAGGFAFTADPGRTSVRSAGGEVA